MTAGSESGLAATHCQISKSAAPAESVIVVPEIAATEVAVAVPAFSAVEPVLTAAAAPVVAAVAGAGGGEARNQSPKRVLAAVRAWRVG